MTVTLWELSLISTACCLLGFANAVSYGPSLVSLTRWDRLSRGPTIFNPDTGRVISLEDYPNYSVVIPLAPDSPSATSNQVFISRRVSGPGEFTVEAPPGYGIMAVIQNLDLRVADDACNDFILFSEVDGRGGGAETTGTCGKVDVRDPSPAPQGLIGPRSFISPSGRMKILFYHGFIWGLVRNFNFDIFDSSLNPDLKVEITFTAFKDCSSNSTETNQEENEPHLNNIDLFTPCPSSVSGCIRQELFCDGSLNCAFESGFGSDEDETECLLGRSNSVGYSRSQHSPPTTIASTTSTGGVSSTEVITSTSTTSSSTSSSSASSYSTEFISTEPPTQQSKSAIKHYKGGTGTDSAGLIGLVRKFPHVEITRPNGTSKTIIIKSSSANTEEVSSTPKVTTTKLTTTTTRRTTKKSKMPLEGGELFVDVKADPIEHSLTDGVSKEEAVFNQDYLDDGMSPHTIAGIFAVTALLLIILGALRVYYCYNKVIWNPHGDLKASESPPEIPHANLMQKMKAFAAESEDIFCENKAKKGLKEQPPSYEILFPLPEEKEGNFKV